MYIIVRGGAVNANIRLDKNSITIDPTYVTMANQRTVTLTNRSDVIAHFKWSRHATLREETDHRDMLARRLFNVNYIITSYIQIGLR